MFSDFLFSIKTVFPLLFMMLVGFVARRFHIIGEEGVKQANKSVFYIFLPLLLCLNIMDTPQNVMPDYVTLLYAMGAVVASFGVLFILAPRICKNPNARGVFIQGVARSNYAIFGIPLVLMMYPDADTSIAALMVVAVVPIFNVAATIVLLVHSGKEISVWHIIRGVLFNPLIIGTLLGFALWLLHWNLPTLLYNPLSRLGDVATPLALFLLGASLDFAKVRANSSLLTIGVISRLVLVPLVLMSIAVALGIRGVSLATLIAVFASPTAVSSYPMAQQLGGDTDFAAAQVVLTTAFSGFTVFLWIFLFKTLGMVG